MPHGRAPRGRALDSRKEQKLGASIAILVGARGRGSNMQAIIRACLDGVIPGYVAVVVGIKEGAPALEKSEAMGVPVAIISPRAYENDQDGYGRALLDALHERRVDLVCLAGYMRILPGSVVRAFPHRILNIHPSLLPLFGGKGMYGEHVHRAVIESGMKVSGCTVHLVDEEYDNGAIVLQAAVPVHGDDSPETLAARILPFEHWAYVTAIRLLAEGKVEVEGGRARLAERVIPDPIPPDTVPRCSRPVTE